MSEVPGSGGLRVEVGGEVLDFDEPRVLTIGRAAESDVVLVSPSVSRRHAELRPGPHGWELVDVGQLGTYLDDRPITRTRVTGPLTVRCGPPGHSSTFQVSPRPAPSAARHRATATEGEGEPDEGFDQTTVLAAPLARDGGDPVARTGPDLLVVAEGRERRFRHPGRFSVGRRPDCSVVLPDTVVSRLHGRVESVPGGWLWTNESEGGSFREGRRVDTQRFDSPITLRLGHPVAGPTLSLVPILSSEEEQRRFAHARWRRVLLRVGGVAAVVVVLVLALVALAALGPDGADTPTASPEGGSTPDRLTDAELDGAKLATVRVLAQTTDVTGKEVTYSGSGSVIDPRGLILTNAHVAAPDEPGLAQEYGDDAALLAPEFLLVGTVDGPQDTPSAPSYRARVVAADGELDVAVIAIYARADGSALERPLDLASLRLGDSSALRTGDDVTILGFPSISGSAAVSVTRGVISTFLSDPDLGPRAEIDTDARIAPGNSGGAAIDNDARIVGIPSALYFEEGTAVVSGRIRPIDAVRGVIEAAETEAFGR